MYPDLIQRYVESLISMKHHSSFLLSSTEEKETLFPPSFSFKSTWFHIPT